MVAGQKVKKKVENKFMEPKKQIQNVHFDNDQARGTACYPVRDNNV